MAWQLKTETMKAAGFLVVSGTGQRLGHRRFSWMPNDRLVRRRLEKLSSVAKKTLMGCDQDH
jgi:hypothetical protein